LTTLLYIYIYVCLIDEKTMGGGRGGGYIQFEKGYWYYTQERW